MNTKNLALIMIVIIVSFLGFCVENIFIAYDDGIINNRNMVFPFMLGYGLAVLTLYLIFGTPEAPRFLKNNLNLSSFMGVTYYFVVSFLAVSIGEIILGYFIEWSCDIVWWNYSDLPLHITKYTSIPTSCIFASLITIFMKFFFSPLVSAFMKMNPRVLAILSISVIVIISIDFIHSGIYMFKHHETLKLWRFDFSKSIKDMIKELI